MPVDDKGDIIDVQSIAVKKIIGRVPNWIIRYGITIVFVVIIATFGIAYSIKYEDKIFLSVTFYNTSEPIEVKSNLNGLVKGFLIKNGTEIKKNDPVLSISNIAGVKKSLKARAILDTLHVNNVSMANLNVILKGVDFIPEIKQQLKKLNKMLATKETNSDEKIKIDLIKERSKVALNSWLRQYILFSQFNGRVFYNELIQQNSYINKDSTVYVIIPKEKEITGILHVPVKYQNKINLGEEIFIKIDDETVSVRATVKSIAQRPSKEYVFAILNIEKSSDVIYDTSKGKAEIVIAENRLLSKLLSGK